MRRRPVQGGAHRRRLLAASAVGVLVAACGGVIAPPPPSGAPDTTDVATVGSNRLVIAPRAARRMQELGFTTRRFSTDSLWGWRAQEKINARFRFAPGPGDSTKVLVELWGPCAGGTRGCLRQEARLMLGSLVEGEAAPR